MTAGWWAWHMLTRGGRVGKALKMVFEERAWGWEQDSRDLQSLRTGMSVGYRVTAHVLTVTGCACWKVSLDLQAIP